VPLHPHEEHERHHGLLPAKCGARYLFSGIAREAVASQFEFPPLSNLGAPTLACGTAPSLNRAMIDIRDESPGDSKAVYQVVSSAFGRLSEAELITELREAGDSAISLVADDDGQIVGHVLLSKMDAPFPALALAPVSVIPTRQRSGIGSALIERAVSKARDEGWAAIFVLGDPNYYERFGFDQSAAAGFTSPYAGRHFTVLKLSPSLSAATGALRHAPAFAALD
jgi:putative acetyltransferase